MTKFLLANFQKLLVCEETSCDIVIWSFIISSSHFMLLDATLIMAPPKGKQAKKLAETLKKTIWYLLVGHKGKLSFSNLTDLVVQPDITVSALSRIIKEENSNLGPFHTNKLEVWTYKHKDFSLNSMFEKLQEIVGGIKFLKGSKDLKCLSPKQKVIEIDLAEDVIFLVQVPPLQKTDTASSSNGESFICLASIQHIL